MTIGFVTSMAMVMVVIFFYNVNSSVAEDPIIGEATLYDPPSLPKNCSVSSLAKNGMYAYVSPGIWADGAACGQTYEVHCLEVVTGPNVRCANVTVLVEVVGVFNSSGQVIFRLSSKAGGTITEPSNGTPNAKLSNGTLNAEPVNGMIINAEYARFTTNSAKP